MLVLISFFITTLAYTNNKQIYDDDDDDDDVVVMQSRRTVAKMEVLSTVKRENEVNFKDKLSKGNHA